VSRIDDLVADLCPEGVQHQRLGEVGTFIRGNGIQKKDFTESGVGCIHYGQIFTHFGLSATATKSFVTPELAARSRKALPGDLVIATTSENDADVCKAVAWLGDAPVAVSSDAYIYRHSLEPKYVSYFFNSGSFGDQKRPMISGTKVRRLSGESLSRIRIPVPPPEVQREVVRVLDKFTQLEEDLEAELEAELEARRLQYAHYRDSLLSRGESAGVQWLSMGEVGQFFGGRRFTKADREPDGIPSIHYGEIYTVYGTSASEAHTRVRRDLATALRFAARGDVVIASVGETVADVGKAVAWLGDEEIAIHDDCFAFRSQMDPKFVAYALQTSNFHTQKEQFVARAKVKRVSATSLAKITIPVPEIGEQRRIVARLDAFDALLSDICVGLPAELAARRKQYEHYRDRLLTFKELAA